MKKILTILLVLCSCMQLRAQFIIRGIVTAASGHTPLNGATISCMQNNTMSNSNGAFKLTVPTAQGKLTISFVGYETKQVMYDVKKDSFMNIVLLATTNSLETVTVNTGYQKQPKERAIGSFTQLDNQLLNQQFSVGIIARLEAIGNGVSLGRKTTGGNGQLHIRGLSTINGPQQPLIVLDNFAYEGDVNNINPNDIESVTLLKDAAAASIWGTKAGNGVIVITTKKSSLNQPLKVELSMGMKITNRQNLWYQPTMSSTDVLEMEQFLFSKGYKFSDTNLSSRPPFSPMYELLFRQRRGQITDAQAANQIEQWKQVDIRNEADRYFYRKAINRQYAINLHGGGSTAAWLFTAGWDDNINELYATYKRLNLRLENTYRLTKKLQLTTGLYYTDANTVSGRTAISELRTVRGTLWPYTSLADANGNALPVYKDFRQTYLDTAGAGKLLDWKYYPLTDYQHNITKVNTTDILANFNAQYQLLPMLRVELKYQYEKQSTNNNTVRDKDSYYTRDYTNRFTQINWSTGAVTNRVPLGSIVDNTTTELAAQKLRYQLNLAHTWGSHELTAIAGGEVAETRTNSNTYRLYGFNSDVLATSKVDFANTYPQYVGGSASYIDQRLNFTQTVYRLASFFANAAYTYKTKYTLYASARRDAGNTFGINTNDRWTPLASAGIGWNLYKEKFYTIKWLPYIKLRASYGVSGNMDPSLTAMTTISYNGINPYTGTPYASTDRFYNPELRWEKQRQLNIGIDFKTANNRIAATVEWYQKKGTDLYGPALLDYTAGLAVSTITKNVASMKGTGMDIELNSLNINRSFKWNTQLIINLYQDEITSYYNRNTTGSSFVGDGAAITGLVGKPVNAVFSYRWAGLDPATGNPQGYVNGLVSKDYATIIGSGTSITDLVYNGLALPRAFGSIGNTFSYKNIALTVRFTYKLGYYFTRTSINYNTAFTGAAAHADYSLRWQKPGDEAFTNVPSLIYPLVTARETFYTGSEILVEKGDHLRLQYITLNYTLYKRQLKQLPFNNVQLFVNANDLGIVWRANQQHLDPDYFSFSIPPAKNFAIGLRAGF